MKAARSNSFHRRSQRGFSLVELLVVLLLVSVLMGAVFRQISQVQARANTERSRVDIFQESREFTDQLGRDLRQAGYPNVRNFASGVLTASPVINDMKNSVGLVKVAVDEIRFEGDMDGDGNVDSLQYVLSNSGNNCPCLRRSQVQKVAGSPLTGQSTAFYTEVQGVQNGTTSDPIFRAFAADGTAVTLPVDISSNANTMASIKTLTVSLTVQAKNPDLETRQYPRTTVRTTVSLNNCSGAATGQALSCQ